MQLKILDIPCEIPAPADRPRWINRVAIHIKAPADLVRSARSVSPTARLALLWRTGLLDATIAIMHAALVHHAVLPEGVSDHRTATEWACDLCNSIATPPASIFDTRPSGMIAIYRAGVREGLTRSLAALSPSPPGRGDGGEGPMLRPRTRSGRRLT